MRKANRPCKKNTFILIPAAGRSERLGRAKQLLNYKGKSFLNHVIDEALSAKPAKVLVITGAYRNEVEDSVGDRPVEIIYNLNWETGMGSGIAAGVAFLINNFPAAEYIIIAACDQPFVSALLFKELSAEQQRSGSGIVTSAYAGTVGIPALFTKKYFAALAGLSGDKGAKKLIKQRLNDVSTIDFPTGNIDVDTEEAYMHLLQ